MSKAAGGRIASVVVQPVVLSARPQASTAPTKVNVVRLRLRKTEVGSSEQFLFIGDRCCVATRDSTPRFNEGNTECHRAAAMAI